MKIEEHKSGSLILSLDFELLWGTIDIYSPEDYGKSNVRNVKKIIPRLITLLEKYDVKATIGFVGMIFYQGKEELLNDLPLIQPSYKKKNLSPYEYNYIEGISNENKDLYFAPELLRLLRQSSNIELGSHTFCHYYCNEEGQTIEEFESDIKKAVDQAKGKGIELHSIIFPRNQVCESYLKVCAKYGFISYRGNPEHFFTKNNIAIFNKIGRFIDTYIPVTKTSYPYTELSVTARMTNVKASRFFRPYNKKLAFLEWLKVFRIKQELKGAAQNNEIYHLWWHPHNFGANIEENFQQLEEIFLTYKYCSNKLGMRSFTMSEVRNYK